MLFLEYNIIKYILKRKKNRMITGQLIIIYIFSFDYYLYDKDSFIILKMYYFP